MNYFLVMMFGADGLFRRIDEENHAIREQAKLLPFMAYLMFWGILK